MFHVPEKYRVRQGRFATAVGLNGAFFIPTRGHTRPLQIIATDGIGHGWEHVSVSLPDRCPTWEEMCMVKAHFWDAEDCVMQLHPPQVDHVNNHRFCLHLWRPTAQDIPRPPSWMVGVKALGTLV